MSLHEDAAPPNGVSLVLRARDILLASYGKTSRHPGNIRLNNIVRSSWDEFYAIPKKNKKEKSAHYASVIEKVEKGGRGGEKRGNGGTIGSF